MTPPRITPSEIDVQQAEKRILRNGVALYTLPSSDFEVLRISFVFRAGSAVQTAPFSASAAANLLAEGSDRLNAQQIAEQLDYYGSWYDVNIDRDYAYISFATLSKFFDRTLDVAAEILLSPAFPEEELRTYAAKRRQRLAIDRTKVDVQAREGQAVYPPGVLLVGGAGVLRQHPQQRRPLSLRHLVQQFRRAVHGEAAAGHLVREAPPGLRVGVGVGGVGLDVVDGGAVHQVRAGDIEHRAQLRVQLLHSFQVTLLIRLS